MSELISVVVPIYNTGKYLVECVEHILRPVSYTHLDERTPDRRRVDDKEDSHSRDVGSSS